MNSSAPLRENFRRYVTMFMWIHLVFAVVSPKEALWSFLLGTSAVAVGACYGLLLYTRYTLRDELLYPRTISCLYIIGLASWLTIAIITFLFR